MNKEQIKGFKDGMEKDANDLASLILAVPAAVGFGAGAIRSDKLSDEQEKLLKYEYNKKDNANLNLRNSIRGAIGGATGTVAGALMGGAMTGAGTSPGPYVVGGLLGGLGGAYKATNKYSKGRAERVKERMVIEEAINRALSNR